MSPQPDAQLNDRLAEAYRIAGLTPPPVNPEDWRVWASNMMLLSHVAITALIVSVNMLKEQGENRQVRESAVNEMWHQWRGLVLFGLSLLGGGAAIMTILEVAKTMNGGG